uniref:3-ketosteroid-9-alpha-monooxygenase oxygenase component-like C-terminal domain-containing protein n=1 Tax=Ciona savignyi TaxID=51511 RepID=H2YV04_CIOSA
HLKVYQIGPGIVHLHFRGIFGSGVFVQNLIPIEPLHLVLTHNLYGTRYLPLFVGKLLLYFEAVQVDRDIMIWNNKMFRARPQLLKEDNLIAKYRRWFTQFYTENSPRLTLKAEDGNSW